MHVPLAQNARDATEQDRSYPTRTRLITERHSLHVYVLWHTFPVLTACQVITQMVMDNVD